MAYLSKKVEQAHIVWFQASNQWVQFDEQQWLIFCFYNEGVSQEQAAKDLCKRFSFQTKEARAFVENIYFSLDNLFNPQFETLNFSSDAEDLALYKLKKSRAHLYSFHGKTFKIVYGSPSLEQYIHLPLAHLEVQGKVADAMEVEVFPFKGHHALRINSGKRKALTADEPGQIKRLLYVELASYFYGVQEDDWLAFIHGSALKRGENVLVITSPGGSGKSTLAGLLQLNGFSFFSDDFIPVYTQTQRAYPFPAALCVKKNSIEVLQSLGQKFRYISPTLTAYAEHPEQLPSKPSKINRMIFVQYKEGAEVELEKMPTLQALYEFLQEAWVGNDMRRAEAFIDWFTKLRLYRFTYGNNSLAIETLTKLMDGDD